MAKKINLKQSGLKVTVPRIKILKMLESALRRHWSAEDIYKELEKSGENVSLATVYRVLLQFEAADIVERQRFDGDHSVFEIKTDSHHDHIVCTQCGQVREFLDYTIETRQKDIATRLGFLLTDHRLHLYGLCKDCQWNKRS
ncbi:MAG: ferric iron uptake transcriptional regulator [Thiotrichales bacterium]|nr:MAG: ferric iron uptake transcriptional regulator [Thiotrichales bacterium]